MTGFMIDPERLSASGAALQSVAARLSAELASFRSELAGFGAPWGSDDIGSLIGAAHDEVSAWAVPSRSAEVAGRPAAVGGEVGPHPPVPGRLF
jgi:hypothetical protein